MYSNVIKMIAELDKAVGSLKGKPCTFATGCDVVMAIGNKTLFNIDDWGVYEDESTGNVTIYNEDSREVIKLNRGIESGTVVSTSFTVTTLARTAGVPVRWNLPQLKPSAKLVTKSRAIGLSELTEEEMKDGE
ncbi:hypothetical protein BH780_gp213 [Bacillus phage Eldridge]|uniref:Uncharacterized protein n=1 Tax=Bacillus phage Eldridge TaxID=1776293 RepID=A0A0Y0AUH2_9CAUD|nr:hypothetical protein BH780_gp213 [Bacillus phage Eldridge]AMB18796.1 hypothetical protein Eldridge_0216 [Bacillus phage Eldridge]